MDKNNSDLIPRISEDQIVADAKMAKKEEIGDIIPSVSEDQFVVDVKPVKEEKPKTEEKKGGGIFPLLISLGFIVLAFFAPSLAIFSLMLLASIVVVIYGKIRYKYSLLINIIFDLILIADVLLISSFWIFFSVLKSCSFIA